ALTSAYGVGCGCMAALESMASIGEYSREKAPCNVPLPGSILLVAIVGFLFDLKCSRVLLKSLYTIYVHSFYHLHQRRCLFWAASLKPSIQLQPFSILVYTIVGYSTAKISIRGKEGPCKDNET